MGTDNREQELLRRCANGDVSAFEPVVLTYRDTAYRYAYSLMHNHHDALDLSQEAFARAFRAIASFDTSRPFQPWFLRVLRNLCLNEIDRRRRRPTPVTTTGDGVEMLTLVAGPGDPRQEAVKQDDSRRLQAAINRLSPDHREIITLRHFEDLAYQQIAEVLDIPIGTVMSRLFHARKNLAKLLKSSTDSE